MSCPICDGEQMPDDVSIAEKVGKRVILRGKVYAIIPPDYTYSPFKNYATVSLYLGKRTEKVKYLKFRTDKELKRWPFVKDGKFTVHGDLHVVDGKELVFDINFVESANK